MIKKDFNRAWTFQKDGSEEKILLNLPHDAQLSEARSKDAPTAGAGGYFQPGKYFYTKSLDVPAEAAGQTMMLEFEGIYRNAEVYVNDAKAAERPYGYSNFFVDLNPYLKYGEENTICVIADNSQAPNSRWYSGSGIYREVSLWTGGSEYIRPQGIKVTTVNEHCVKVHVDAAADEGAQIAVQVPDGETGEILAEGCGEAGSDLCLEIPEAKLWDAENPYLYTLKVQLKRGEDILDEAETRFGIRTVAWGGFGLRVNGREVLLRGACVHHDNGILGACAFRDAERRRVRILKEAGFNAIRSAHNPVSKAMLDACDEYGMYMMDETFDMWFIQKTPNDYGGETFEKWWKEDTAAMIEKDFSHPSVILYSIGNEISDLGAENGQQMCREMADYVRSLDSSRPVTLGINLMLATMVAKGGGLYGKDKDGNDKGTGTASIDSMPTSTFFNVLMNRMGGLMELAAASGGADKIVEKVSGYLDMPGYNYAGPRYKKEAKRWPERAFTGSETLPKHLYQNWQMVKEIPNLTGDFMWTGWDYLGEAGIGSIQYKDKKTKQQAEEGLMILSGSGVIDICGKQRPETVWNKMIWGLTDKPAIAAEPYTHADDFAAASMWRDTDAVASWSWEGCEGKKSDVIVYADADHVKLYVNRRGVGRQKVHEYKAKFRNIPYEDGNIVAVACDKSGKEISRAVLRTATGDTRIRIAADKKVLAANGQDLCFAEINLTGKNGVVRSAADQKLTVKVEGAGTLQAFGSARPNMAETYTADTHTTFYGKALAVIRAGYEPGEIKVTVSGEGLADTSFVIEVQA